MPAAASLPDGLWVALATPFRHGGALDLPALSALAARVRRGGADALVAAGSTGEASALDDAERDDVVGATLAAAGGLPVVVGTGASCTATTVRRTARAQELGAAGALVVVPPYVKPTQAGIVAHFQAVAAAVPRFPLIAYNVPSRTGVNLQPATVQQLWEIESVRGLKESSGDLLQIGAIARDKPVGRLLFAGDDALALPSIALGADGLVSVAANVAPRAVADLVCAARRRHRAAAEALHARLQPLFAALFAEPNPIPLKAALAALGVCEDVLRLPLLPASAATRARVQGALSPEIEALEVGQ